MRIVVLLEFDAAFAVSPSAGQVCGSLLLNCNCFGIKCAVMPGSGQHVYQHAVSVGDTYECLPETNNSNDAKAIAVRSASNEVIGHVPVILCDYVLDLFARFPGKLVMLW